MAWTNPPDWTTITIPTAAQFNTYLSDNLNYLKGRVDVALTNQSGGNLTAGAVVIFDGSNNNSFTTTTQVADLRVIGVLTEDVNSAATGNVMFLGVGSVQISGSVSRGETLVTSSTAGKAQGAGIFGETDGMIGYALEAGTDTTIQALIMTRPKVTALAGAGYVSYGLTTAAISDLDKYDPDTWTSMTSGASPARYWHTFRGSATALHAIMGYDGTNALADNEQYIPDTWTSKTDAPATGYPLAGGHAGHYNGVIAVQAPGTATIYEYDMSGDIWTTGSSGSATSTSYRPSGVADGNLYLFSGATSTNTDEYDYAGTITAKSITPARRYSAHGAGMSNQYCLIYGGYDGSNAQDDLYKYDPDTWTTLTASGSNVYGHALMEIDGKCYAAFGQDGTSRLTATSEYNPATDTWTPRTAGPSPARQSVGGGSL